jgi:hypothetical protein
MRKRELIIVWALTMLMLIELSALLSLVYFTQLPFFLFVFTVALKLLSFFLIGATTLFLVLILRGIRLELTIESWKEHIRETLRFIGSSFFLTLLVISLCLVLGVLIVFLMEKIYFLPNIQGLVKSIRRWIVLHFY